METDEVYIRVTQKEYERLVKLIHADVVTREKARERQRIKSGRAESRAVKPEIHLEVLDLAFLYEHFGVSDVQDNTEAQLDSIDEQA